MHENFTIDQRQYSHRVYQQSVNQRILISLGVASSPHERLLAAARHLAVDVHGRERNELTRLVADTADARPAGIEFATPSLVNWRTDGGARRGSINAIHSYYEGLDRGRLVIQGAAGSGKSVLAIALARDLATVMLDAPTKPSGEGDDDSWIRVGVRVSASGFAMSQREGGAPNPEQVADQFDQWLAGQLRDVHGLKERDAAGLIAAGWIIPIIDGIDEMDPSDQEPSRAAALIGALNRPVGFTPSGLRPVVLTCRSDRYRVLADLNRGDSAPPRAASALEDATAVELEPLTRAAVRDYLLYRFPDPAGSGLGQPRWGRVLESLQDSSPGQSSPSSPGLPADGGESLLAGALRSPLRLFLAVDGYRDPKTDPAHLLSFTHASDLDDHLFSRFIPAVTASSPGQGGKPLNGQDVTRWMSALARHLDDQRARGGSSTDIQLPEIWRMAGRPAQYLAAAIIMLCAATMLTYLGLAYLVEIGRPQTGAAWLVVVLGIVLVLGSGAGSIIARPSVQRLDWRIILTPAGRRRVAFAGAIMAILSSASLLFFSWVSAQLGSPASIGLGTSLIMGGVWGALYGGIVLGIGERPHAIRHPSELVTQGLAYDVASISTFVLFGVGIGIVASVNAIDLPAGELTSGVLFGASYAAIAMAGSPWLRYAVASVLLRRRGDLPARPARFLDWAYAAGLVRMAGLAVQFRHRDFQEWVSRSAADEPLSGQPAVPSTDDQTAAPQP